MKVLLKDKNRKLIKEYFFDFDKLLLQAQSISQSDPIKIASEILLEQFRTEGISSDSKEEQALRKQLSDIASSGNEEIIIELMGEKTPGERPKSKLGTGNSMENTELFEKVIIYPNSAFREIYYSLVGLDSVKDRLIKEAILLTLPRSLHEWSKKIIRGRLLLRSKR